MTGRAFFLLAILLAGLVAACTPVAEPAPSAPTTTPAPTPDPTVTVIRDQWAGGPHADTYDLEKGPNTYCARCHSPQNWDPAATIDPPPNCVSCKFSFEPEPRIAVGNPLVPEEEWQSIGCVHCHPEQDGAVQPDIAWLNVTTGYHETVSGPAELCTQCHLDEGLILHERHLGESAHVDYSCTDCHDAHEVSASCTAAGCHEAITMTAPLAEEVPAGETLAAIAHSTAHQHVDCVACHDAAGLAVGPAVTGDTWTTFRDVEFLGRINTEAYQSHNLQKQVRCSRCHFPDNPWQLEQYDDAS